MESEQPLEKAFPVPIEGLFDVPGIVAEDVVDGSGGLILPLGTQLAWIERQGDEIVGRLRSLGIETVLVRRERGLTVKKLREIFAKINPPLQTVDKKIARRAVHSVEKAFRSIAEGHFDEELLLPILPCGAVLARELERHPSVLFSILNVREKDEYTFVHSLNVSLMAGGLASTLRPGDGAFVEQIVTASLLHDLGKAQVAPEILNKPAPLTAEEFEEMKKHPLLGEAMAKETGITAPDILFVIRNHHERWGGGGYPDGLRGKAIPTAARIAAVADVFDALTAERAYKGAMPPREALSLIVEASGTHFDPVVGGHLLRLMGLFPPGTVVELSDYSLAVVVSSAEGDLFRPTVLLHVDGTGLPVNEVLLIDLRRSPLHIRKPVGHMGRRDM